MPTQLPSSFASAAAGNRDSRGPWNDSSRGSGSGEWTRPNGTRTFRRPSATPATMNSITAEHLPVTVQDAMPVSAHPPQSTFNTSLPPRYSKEELLDLYRAPTGPSVPVETLFMPEWNPGHANGNSTRSWGKTGESGHAPQDPHVCWEANGNVGLLGLQEMTMEERELFSSNVNSTVKNVQHAQQNKDGIHQGTNGRKLSISVGTAASHYILSSPTVSRPGTRRWETGDTNPFGGGAMTSPTGRFSRDDPSPWLGRKNVESKDMNNDEGDEAASSVKNTQHFGLARNNPPGTAGVWNPSPSTSTGGGAFGNFSISGNRAMGGGTAVGRGESRLAHLIPGNSEGALTKMTEAVESSKPWRTRNQRSDNIDAFGGDDIFSGSAALGGAKDISPKSFPAQLLGTASHDTPVKGNTGDFGMSGFGMSEGNGLDSPETNPYRSPPTARENGDDNDRGSASEVPSNVNTLSRTFGATGFEGSDRSQTSSAGAKAYPSLGNLGGLTGWPAASVSTPDRERNPGFGGNPFGGNIFLGDAPPGPSSLGGVFGGQNAAPMMSTGGAMRGSKLGCLFPAAMQAQMQQSAHEQDALGDSVPDVRQGQLNPLGAIGRAPVGQPRDADSPLRNMRLDDMFHSSTDPTTPSFPMGTSSSLVGADPNAPTKVMVMPDRMRWVYLDPQGLIQGPFNGLEMNDWYKANFFSPDLRVKKVEDNDFEPLGQLIRRIGNSREPFLVPQMGIPHGPPSQNGPFGVADTRGGVVPPLQNAFPTFGRTLTAEEQNNLERRKQEEQILMARQREFLAQQQALMKMSLQTPGLHHHSSMHSLQNFAGATSPIGMAPGPIGPLNISGSGLAQTSGFFDSAMPMSQTTPGIGTLHPELFSADLSGPERQMLVNMQANLFPGGQGAGAQAGESGVLHGQLPLLDQLHAEYSNPRLQEFLDLRSQRDSEAETAQPFGAESRASSHAAQMHGQEAADMVKEVMDLSDSDDSDYDDHDDHDRTASHQPLSLTQQVRKTQADAAATGFPMPFPPPQPSTPLPAPTAQRAKSKLPSQYGSRSGSASPDMSSDGATVPAPPAAPWASTETRKGPSLKEIQEAEAQKAAKQEQAAMAARRAALDAEAAASRERETMAPSSVLPSTSTWGTGSPVGAPAGAWAARPTAKVAPAPENPSKKTLAEIQREEEMRKQRQQQLAAVQASTSAAQGKRYADLASRTSGPPPGFSVAAPGGWTTVGASGKVRAPPTGPAATRQPSNTAKPTPAPKPVPKPASAAKDNTSTALEAFNKWLRRELTRGLDKFEGDIDSFAATLHVLPLDPSLIADSVYANSSVMDGRHFGEEFVRRKRLAEKGIVEKQPVANDAKNGGGWNEVAKKGNNVGTSSNNNNNNNNNNNSSHKEDPASLPSGSQYKVVPGRKKGKK